MSVSVAFANRMSIVEGYQAPIQRAFNVDPKEAPDIGSEEALKMAVKPINDRVGPVGLVATLLVSRLSVAWTPY